MSNDDLKSPDSGNQPGKFYRPTGQSSKSNTAGSDPGSPDDANQGPAMSTLLPLQGRLLASLIASSLTGLSLGGRILLTIVTVIFVVREMVETRRDWYGGSTSIEQVELTRIQQQRERAEVIVAQTAARKNVQEELTAVAKREADVMAAVKEVGTGFGAPLGQASGENMIRFRVEYAATQDKIKACKDSGTCSETQQLRLENQADMYRMLFGAAKARLLNAMDKTRQTVLSPTNMELEPAGK